MSHETIIPKDKKSAEELKEDALGFFSLDEGKIKSLIEIMENNPEVFSTYRVRRVMNISTDLAYSYHKFLFYLIHHFYSHDKSPAEIKNALVSIGCKEKAVSIFTDVLERLSERNLTIYEITYYDYRNLADELNKGVLQKMRGELLLRAFRHGDDDWKLPLARIFLELSNISEEPTKIELILTMDELGRFVSAFEEACDDFINDVRRLKRGDDKIIALER